MGIPYRVMLERLETEILNCTMKFNGECERNVGQFARKFLDVLLPCDGLDYLEE